MQGDLGSSHLEGLNLNMEELNREETAQELQLVLFALADSTEPGNVADATMEQLPVEGTLVPRDEVDAADPGNERLQLQELGAEDHDIENGLVRGSTEVCRRWPPLVDKKIKRLKKPNKHRIEGKKDQIVAFSRNPQTASTMFLSISKETF